MARSKKGRVIPAKAGIHLAAASAWLFILGYSIVDPSLRWDDEAGCVDNAIAWGGIKDACHAARSRSIQVGLGSLS